MLVFNARVKLTEIAKPTSTVIAKAALMIDEIQISANKVDELDFTNAKLVLGPQNGRLVHELGNIVITYDPRLSLKNFIVSMIFVNPYDTSTTGNWDYGILFRNGYANDQYRLTVLSNQSWTLVNAKTWENIFSSKDKNLNAKAGESNTIWIIVIDAKAYLFINGTYIRSLNVSAKLKAGDVSVGTGLYYGNKTKKRSQSFTTSRSGLCHSLLNI